MILGIDVSNNQGRVVDALAAKSEGVSFIWSKATEGTGFTDRFFGANRRATEKAGLLVGAYHFLHRGQGAQQAQAFVSYVTASGGFPGILAAVDVELQNSTIGPLYSDVLDFVHEFRRLVPNHPLFVYSGRWYWDGYLNNPPAPAGCPLWDSAYVYGSGDPHLLLNQVTPGYFAAYGGWAHHTVRQFSSSGTVANMGKNNCDLNCFEGTTDQLRQYTGGSALQASTQLLRVGDHGADVEQIQRWLHNPVTGVFNANDERCVEMFQHYHRLSVDGIVGPETWAALKANNAPRPVTPTPAHVAQAGALAHPVTPAKAPTPPVVVATATPSVVPPSSVPTVVVKGAATTVEAVKSREFIAVVIAFLSHFLVGTFGSDFGLHAHERQIATYGSGVLIAVYLLGRLAQHYRLVRSARLTTALDEAARLDPALATDSLSALGSVPVSFLGNP